MNDASKTRVPPSDLTSEQAVLGSVLIASEKSMARIYGKVKESTFYWEKNRVIYRTMVNMFEQNEPIDVVSLAEELRKRGKLDDITTYYLTELTEATPFPGNILYYAKIILEKEKLRKLGELGSKLSNESYDPSADPNDILQDVAEELATINKDAEHSDFYTVGTVVSEMHEDIILSIEKNEPPGFMTGMVELDKMAQGFRRGSLVVVGGRPGSGKTATVLQWADYFARHLGLNVTLVELEMVRTQLMKRLISSYSNVPFGKIMNPRTLDAYELEQIVDAESHLANSRLIISDPSTIELQQLVSHLDLSKARYGLDVAIVDHMKWIQVPKVESDYQRIDRIMKTLKGAAKRLDVAIIVVSQLSRSVEQRSNKRPMLADFRDSGSIEEDADIVIGLYRQGYYDVQEGKQISTNDIEITCLKNRDGLTGMVALEWDGKVQKIRNIEQYQQDAPPRYENAPF